MLVSSNAHLANAKMELANVFVMGRQMKLASQKTHTGHWESITQPLELVSSI